MYRIRTFNKISPVGLNRLDPALYAVSDSETDEDAILVRSAKLLDYDFPKNLLAISRAGAGVNNIPLDRHIHVVKDINELYKRADYITIHIHYTKDTERMIDAKAIGAMKRGVRFINLARGEIVDDDAMLAALDTGWVAAYVTDFPNNRLVGAPHVLAMPHLGASTPESEQNCAVMAVDQLRDYLENGNIRNSVNLPAVSQERSGVCRLCLIHKNVPAMLASITTLLSRDGINVENLSNKSRGDYAYTIVDLSAPADQCVIDEVTALENVIRVRVIQ